MEDSEHPAESGGKTPSRLRRFVKWVLVAGLLVWAWSEVTKDVVILKPFSAPEALEDRGSTGLYLTNLVADRIAVLQTAAFAGNQRRFQPASGENIPEVEIPETKLSLKSIVEFARGVLPDRFVHAIAIDGDVALDGTALTVVARIHRPGEADAIPIGPFTSPVSDPRMCMDKVAEKIVEELDPVVMANYRYNVDETPEGALALAQTRSRPGSASSDDLDVFIASVWLDQGHLGAAKAKCERVLARSSGHLGALISLGRYYELVEDFATAERYYRAALGARKTQPEPLNNLAYRYLDNGNVRGALSLFDQALQSTTAFSWAYRGRADTYDRLGANGIALTALRQGIEATRSDIDRASAYEALGTYLVNKNAPRQGSSFLNESIRLNPSVATVHEALGNALLDTGDEAGFNREYEKALSLAVGPSEIYRDWGAALAARQRYEAALEKYAKAGEADPWSPLPPAESARLLLKLGRDPEAREMFDKARALSPFPLAITNRWVLADRESGNCQDAVRRFRAGIPKQAQWPILGNIADCEYDLHQYLRGDEDYGRAASHSPYPARAYYENASRFIDQSRLEEAMLAFRKSIAADRGYDQAHLGLALALLRTGKPAAAEAEFQEAVRSAIYPSGILQSWADAEASYGRLWQAIGHQRMALDVDPNNVDARVALARSLFGVGWNSAAERELSTAAKDSITPGYVRRAWGDMLFEKRDFVRAEAQFSLAVELSPSLIDAYDGRVRSLQALGRSAEAAGAAAQAVRLNPFDPRAYDVLANYLRSSGRREEALGAYDRAAARFPWLGQPLAAKGKLLVLMDRVEEGRRSFELALSREPDNTDLYVQSGAGFSSIGEFGKAVEFYDRALKIDPHSVDALLGKAEALAPSGVTAEVSHLCETAVDVGADAASSNARWAQILANAGDYSEAIRKYDAALSIEPMRTDLYVDKAVAYEQNGQRVDAIRTLGLARKLRLNSPDVQRALGDVYCRTQFSLAQLHYRQAASDAPRSADFLFSLADCQQSQGQNRAATETYRAALQLDPGYLPWYGSVDRTPRLQAAIQFAIEYITKTAPLLDDPEVRAMLEERVTALTNLQRDPDGAATLPPKR